MSTTRNVGGILAIIVVVISILSTTQVDAARVMQLNPHNLGAFVDAYADGTLQLRVNPITSDKFYEVTDVITATPLEESGLIIDCSSDTNCKISHKLYTQSEELQLFATTEYLQVTYSVDGNIKSQGRVDLSVSEPKCRLEFPAAKRLYGLPEHAVDLSLKKGHDYRMYNLDVFHYKLDDGGGIYGTIPFIMAHGSSLEQGGTTGVLILNSADGTTKVEEGDVMAASWRAEVGPVNVIFFKGPTPADVQRHHSALTGTGYMPPLFSLGFNQCRWNYRSTEDCLDVDAGFDTHNIPYDVLWLDIEHTNGKKYFTWDHHNFPKPLELINKIAASGRKMVTITDPHIKKESGYYVHDEGSSKGYMVHTAQGTDYEGHCWPGTSKWVDFYNKDARDWYATMFSFSKYTESTPDVYTWIDMNEPSVFNSPDVTMDRDAIHRTADGTEVKHRYLHNMYGFYHTMAAYEGHLLRSRELNTGKINRPFILTRSFFAGSQRYCAMWTGDNMAKWDHLEKSIPMLLTLSLSNFPFVGADVGGFFFNPSSELMTRWMQVGAFYPFFRAHAHLETKRREPWLFDDETTRRIRDAISLRYTLLPYLYTAFWISHTEGHPVMRPLVYDFPFDESVLDEQKAFMVGDGILVRPIVAEGATSVSVKLPQGATWYDFFTGAKMTKSASEIVIPDITMDTIPVFLRGGSIVTVKHRHRRNSQAMTNDPLTLYVSLDADTQVSEGKLFMDDQLTFDYESKGAYSFQRLSFQNGVLSSTGADVPRNARAVDPDAFAARSKVEKVVVLGLENADKIKSVDVKYTSPIKKALSPSASNISMAAAEFEIDAQSGALLIRKPDVFADADWTITINM